MHAIAVLVGYTWQLCSSYGCWHHVRGQVSFVVHSVDAHLSVDSSIAGRVVFSMRMWLHSSFCGRGGAIGYRWWRTRVRRSKSDAKSQGEDLCANTDFVSPRVCS